MRDAKPRHRDSTGKLTRGGEVSLAGSVGSLGVAVDLDQLAARESEQIEWKENVADIDDVVETLSAFANDLANLGGGYVVCGAAERKDEHGFATLARVGLDAKRLKEVEGTVLSRCRERVSPPVTPLIQELASDNPERRILVFIQPSTGHAHTARRGSDGAKHFVRVSRSTIEARNGTLRDLLVRKGAQEPWDRRPCPHATVNDLDLLALRDALQRMRVFSADLGLEPYLSDQAQLSAFVPPLFLREPITGVLRPRNFAILLFGREVQRFIPGANTLFSIYPGVDRSDPHAERHELAGTLLEQARRLSELLDVQSYTTFDKTNARAPNAVKYPKRALYEAMGNALAHRDYELMDPTRITVFDNRIEVLSPGSLPLGVNPVAFREGQAAPRWRNQTLAWFFNRLQIAQAEGQGIPTILRSMREEGCPPPILEASELRVVCTLPAHPRHAVLRELREIDQAIALGQLGEAQQRALKALDRDPSNYRLIQLLAEIQTALRDPDPIAHILQRSAIDLEKLPSSVQVQLSEALSSSDQKRDRYRSLANRLLTLASQGRLEELEVRRVAVGLMRSRNDEAALALVERSLSEHPEWRDNASLLQLRGDAKIGLAKRCRNTAAKVAPATRERVWRQFHEYLTQAERDLRKAETLSADAGLSAIIRKNLSYIEQLKNAHRPRRRG